MRRNKAEDLTSIIQKYLRQEGLETPLNELRLINSWPEVAGEKVARYTESLHINNQILYIKLRSPALRNNLSLKKQQLIDLLNKEVGVKIIVNIVFN